VAEEELQTRQHDDTAEGATEPEVPAPDWLKLTQEAERLSIDYINASLRQQWDKNLKHFQSKHAPGSKYNDPGYKNRSRIFRPKTRATVRKHEAAVAQAYFSTRDVLDLQPEDDSSEVSRLAADVGRALVQYRLTKTIPWFQLVIGAFQDTEVMGVCVSRQAWRYEERIVTEMVPMTMVAADPMTGQPVVQPVMDAATGMPAMEPREKAEVLRDEPEIALFPVENVRLHPGADWTDPINSSPFLLVKVPMFAGDVKARAKQGPNQKTTPWILPEADADGLLRKALITDTDQTRQTREQDRQDPKQIGDNTPITDFTLVWVVENIMRVDGQDWVYYTLGTDHLLSEPQPIEKVYWHCETGHRPYVMGKALIEAHRAYASAKVELGEDLQREANEIANQRLDNVKLAMNGRIFVKAGANVDLPALLRHTPGGAVMMTNPETDVKVERAADVTASSYQEQDRVNNDFDEIAGSFSPSSIQSNRQMNETVGGMQLLAGASNAIIEYDLRVFTETWAEPVLRQLVLMEQIYETDPKVLALAGKKGKIWEESKGQAQLPVIAQVLKEELEVSVNVGYGVTDPQQRMGRILMAANATGQIYGPPIRNRLNDALLEEIWGVAGYKDITRFFTTGDNPQVQQLMAQIQELTKQLETKQLETQGKVRVAEINAQAKLDEQQLENQGEVAAMVVEAQLQAQLQPIMAAIDQQGEVLRAMLEGRQARQLSDHETLNALTVQAHGQKGAERQLDIKGRQGERQLQLKGNQAKETAATKAAGEGASVNIHYAGIDDKIDQLTGAVDQKLGEMGGQFANAIQQLAKAIGLLGKQNMEILDQLNSDQEIVRDPKTNQVTGTRRVSRRPQTVN
jgi:hypothetical protein